MIKRSLMLLGMAVLLSACGFHLRGTETANMALKELDVSARDSFGPTVKELIKTLQSSGVKVYQGAAYKLVLVKDEYNQRAASYNGSSRASEYQVTDDLSYEIRGTKDLVLMADKVSVQRAFQEDGNNLTGSDQQSSQARKEMRRDMIQQLVLRLQTITPDRLDRLQQAAEAKAKAEADAEAAAQRAIDEQPQQSPIQIPGK